MTSPEAFEPFADPVGDVVSEAPVAEVVPEPVVEVVPVLAEFIEDAGQPLYVDKSNPPKE